MNNRKRALITFASGVLCLLVTPFAFFPEIMGDTGPKKVGILRNVAGATALVLASLVTFLGLAWFVITAVKRAHAKQDILRP